MGLWEVIKFVEEKRQEIERAKKAEEELKKIHESLERDYPWKDVVREAIELRIQSEIEVSDRTRIWTTLNKCRVDPDRGGVDRLIIEVKK